MPTVFDRDFSGFDLTDPADAEQYIANAATKGEWQARVDAVMEANGGKPDWWLAIWVQEPAV